MVAREGLFNPVVVWAKLGAGVEELACFYAKSSTCFRALTGFMLFAHIFAVLRVSRDFVGCLGAEHVVLCEFHVLVCFWTLFRFFIDFDCKALVLLKAGLFDQFPRTSCVSGLFL